MIKPNVHSVLPLTNTSNFWTFGSLKICWCLFSINFVCTVQQLVCHALLKTWTVACVSTNHVLEIIYRCLGVNYYSNRHISPKWWHISPVLFRNSPEQTQQHTVNMYSTSALGSTAAHFQQSSALTWCCKLVNQCLSQNAVKAKTKSCILLMLS